MKSAPEHFVAQVHGPITVVQAKMVLQQQHRLAFGKIVPADHADFAEENFLQHPKIGTVKPQREGIVNGFNHGQQLLF
jgi:hypothetical protein